jgi:hypothetical protein
MGHPRVYNLPPRAKEKATMSEKPQAQSSVLEDNEEALFDVDANEKVEYVNLDEATATTEKTETPAPDAKAPEAKTPAATAQPNEDDDLPQEFKGKSKKEIAKMYQDAHKLIGRQGAELGDLRSRVDVAVQASLAALKANKQTAPAPATKPEPMDDSEFFANPRTAIEKAIANHPALKRLEQAMGATAANEARSRATQNTEKFMAAHPDAQEILNDEEFRGWVNASPIRQRLLHQAHTKFDFAAGDEVFSTWKALKGAKQASSKAGETPAADEVSAAAATMAKARAAKAAQDAAAKAAGVPTAGGSTAGSKAGAPATGGKIYRRVDVLKLMEDQPERYEAMADEIGRAYAEGRVR